MTKFKDVFVITLEKSDIRKHKEAAHQVYKFQTRANQAILGIHEGKEASVFQKSNPSWYNLEQYIEGNKISLNSQ